jgi:hypothetical protein
MGGGTVTARIEAFAREALRALQRYDEVATLERAERARMLTVMEDIGGGVIGLDCTGHARSHDGETCPIHEWVDEHDAALASDAEDAPRPKTSEIVVVDWRPYDLPAVHGRFETEDAADLWARQMYGEQEGGTIIDGIHVTTVNAPEPFVETEAAYDTLAALGDLQRIALALAADVDDPELQGYAADINAAVAWFKHA